MYKKQRSIKRHFIRVFQRFHAVCGQLINKQEIDAEPIRLNSESSLVKDFFAPSSGILGLEVQV